MKIITCDICNFHLIDANARCSQIYFGKEEKKSIWLLNKIKSRWKAFKTET